MKSETAVINGSEISANLPETLQALSQFYHAFNHGDLKAMRQNWEQSTEVSMSNPLGGVMRGWDEIEQVYLRIFTGPVEVYVEYFDYTIHQAGEMFTAVGKERGYLKTADTKIDLAIRTSRIYRQTEGKWQQLHHHGSMDNTELLSVYQTTVKQA